MSAVFPQVHFRFFCSKMAWSIGGIGVYFWGLPTGLEPVSFFLGGLGWMDGVLNKD